MFRCAFLAALATARAQHQPPCGAQARQPGDPYAVDLANGVSLPCVSLGTGDSVKQTAANLKAALKAGFRGVDTALTYFDQGGVADAIAAEVGKYPRPDIVITTKVPGGGRGVDNYKSTTFDAHENLRLLKVDYVDLLLVHWSPLIGCDCATIQEQWRAMEDFYVAQKARAIGVSNYCKACFECIARNSSVAPMVNQIEFHIGMGRGAQLYASELVDYMFAHNIVPMAYSPLGPTFNTTEKNELIEGNLTNSIGKRHGKSGAQVALRWVIQQGIPVATRASNPAYLAEDIDLFGNFSLSEAEVGVLDRAKEPEAPTGGGRQGGPCLFCHD